MRDIVFRAWDRVAKDWRWRTDSTLEEIMCFGIGAGYPNLDIMQYTGLEDKNGRKIFACRKHPEAIIKDWY